MANGWTLVIAPLFGMAQLGAVVTGFYLPITASLCLREHGFAWHRLAILVAALFSDAAAALLFMAFADGRMLPDLRDLSRDQMLTMAAMTVGLLASVDCYLAVMLFVLRRRWSVQCPATVLGLLVLGVGLSSVAAMILFDLH